MMSPGPHQQQEPQIPEIMMSVPESNAMLQMVLHFMRSVDKRLTDMEAGLKTLTDERSQRKGAMALVEWILKYGFTILVIITVAVVVILRGWK